MREKINYTITACWEKHTIHFLNQVALISSKARRWAGSRAFSVPREACCWGNDSRENVLSITSSMYLKQSGREKSPRRIIYSTSFASLLFLFVCFFPCRKCILTQERWRSKLTSQGGGSKMSSPPFGSRSSIGSEVLQIEGQNCVKTCLREEYPANWSAF